MSAKELLSQALALHGENRLDEAAVHYREVLAIEPDNLQARFNLATIFHSGGDLSGAIANYRRVLELEPGNCQVLYHLANALKDQGSKEEAAGLYHQILALDHAFTEAHYNLGILHYQQGEYELAKACYREALNIDPSHGGSLYNLGIIHFEQNDYEQAAACYEKALAVRPDDVDTLYNLAFTCAKLGQLEKAALHYHEAIELAPDDPELHNLLGSILRKLNELELAETCYRQAVDLRPDFGGAWTNLATILQTLGRYDEALVCYRKAIGLGDQTESAEYMIAALTGSNRQTSPHSYVRELYDSFADNFEKSLLGNLKYKTPELLRKICLSLDGKEGRFRRAVDLGCGTGLAGEQFRDMTDQLTGVDLSEKMLNKAEERGIYDRLFCDEIVDFLEGDSESGYDLVIAADVLIYSGELESFFRSVRKRLESGGYLLFSTEKLESPGDYGLLKTGRYAHSEAYIRSLSAENGFRVESLEEVDRLRREKDKWIRGYLVALCRV